MCTSGPPERRPGILPPFKRIGRRKVVRTNLEALLVARRLLDQYEELWRARIDRMNELITETADAVDTAETKESNR